MTWPQFALLSPSERGRLVRADLEDAEREEALADALDDLCRMSPDLGDTDDEIDYDDDDFDDGDLLSDEEEES